MDSLYPTTIPLESGSNRPIRGPYSSVTNAVHNPQLDSLPKDGEWPPVPEESEPSTEASDASGEQDGLSRQDIQAPTAVSPDLASQKHEAGPANRDPAHFDGKGNSSSGSACLPAGESSNGPAKPIDAELEVSHMAPWVDDSLGGLKKK